MNFNLQIVLFSKFYYQCFYISVQRILQSYALAFIFALCKTDNVAGGYGHELYTPEYERFSSRVYSRLFAKGGKPQQEDY